MYICYINIIYKTTYENQIYIFFFYWISLCIAYYIFFNPILKCSQINIFFYTTDYTSRYGDQVILLGKQIPVLILIQVES